MTSHDFSILSKHALSLESYIIERSKNSISHQFKKLLMISHWDLAELSDSSLANEWGNYAYRVGQRLIALVDQENNHPYHNKKHINQVLSACMLLVSSTNASNEAKKELGLLLGITMLAHDLKHDGYTNDVPVGDREKLSAFIAHHVFEYESKALAETYHEKIKIILDAIQYTEPQVGVPLVRHLYEKNPLFEHLVGVLATESDILASVLPHLGVENGRLLDLEFQEANHALSHKIDNPEGRIHFLKQVQFISDASINLNLQQICLMQIQKGETQ